MTPNEASAHQRIIIIQKELNCVNKAWSKMFNYHT